MRVISGAARGRKLKEPTGDAIRPTGDMVKESIFDIVQFDIEGRRALDLFAGTGQLGVEALSRGAGSAVFVDSSPEAVKLIKENVRLCGFEGASAIYLRDAFSFLEDCEAFDLIFVDPPYSGALAASSVRKAAGVSRFPGNSPGSNASLAFAALEKIIEFDKLKANGIIICEMRADGVAPAVSKPGFVLRQYIYGRVKIVKYEHCSIPGEL